MTSTTHTSPIATEAQCQALVQPQPQPHSQHQPQPELRILRIKAVADKLGIGKSTIYDWLDVTSPRYDPSFPKPIKLSAKSIGWLSTEIEDWMKSKIALSRGQTKA